ncbi:hypothetical protein [Natronorubrum sp. FCH18a]|uniref:hypothetical protein n=1 Tax=Natronorubrum sp. FCH18a TaxID=3447018 RepID=UPI003F519627
MTPLGDGRGGSGSREGLTFTDQAPVATDATVSLQSKPPSNVWNELVKSDGFHDAFVDAVLDAVRGRTYLEAHDVLEEAGVEALNGSYRTLILRTARGDEQAMWTLLREARGLGTGRSPFTDVISAAKMFEVAVENTPDRNVPTIAVQMSQTFRDVRADQRRDVCELIATLARGCDVRLIASGLVTRWFASEHRADLPGVSDACSIPLSRSPPVDELVEAAWRQMDPDGREAGILRSLAQEPGETLTYRELYADSLVSDQRVRQCIQTLRETGLIDSFGPQRDRRVELLEAGRMYLETLDREIGRQRRLDESVSQTGKSRTKDRVTPDAHDTPLPDADQTRPFQVRYMGRSNHVAAAASATDGGVTLVDDTLEAGEDARTHLVSYDPDRDEAVVSVHGSGAFPYVVSTAVALASPRFIDRVLPMSRLETLDEPPAILRDARCVGWLSDEALADGQVLRDSLVDAGVELQNLTRKHRNGGFNDRGTIMQLAHGLAGAITHLLEAFGVDLVREIRVPSGLERERQLQPMAESISISAAIQARYGAFATYRQLFESREEKRHVALTPDVDATDPFGTLIGSYVIRGPDLHRFEGYLTDALEAPADVHDDAPEIAIRLSVVDADRRATYAIATRRMCEAKNLEATREAVSFLQAFTGSPYTVTRTLQYLGHEETSRQIHLDEVRYALGTLPAERILPDSSPTVSKAVHTLLTASRSLTQTEIAERAGISTRSVRNHIGHLEAFALIEVMNDGYRLALPFREERCSTGGTHLPWYLTPNRDRDDYRDATAKGILWEVVFEINPTGEKAVVRLFDRIKTLQIPPDVWQDLGEVWPWAPPLLDAVRVLAAEEPAREFTNTIIIGAEPEQTALPTKSATPSIAEAITVADSPMEGNNV